MAKVCLTDTGFWLGLVDSRDQYHEDSLALSELIETNEIIFPWPCLYETISTHLIRRRDRLLILEKFLKKPNVTIFDDSKYRVNAFDEVFKQNMVGYTHSLTDSVIREILKDINVKINYLITFNNKDFEDLCQKRNIDIP